MFGSNVLSGGAVRSFTVIVILKSAGTPAPSTTVAKEGGRC